MIKLKKGDKIKYKFQDVLIAPYDDSVLYYHEDIEYIQPQKLTLDLLCDDNVCIWFESEKDFKLFSKLAKLKKGYWDLCKTIVYLNKDKHGVYYHYNFSKLTNYVLIKFEPSMIETEQSNDLEKPKNYIEHFMQDNDIEIGEKFKINIRNVLFYFDDYFILKSSDNVDNCSTLWLILAGKCAIQKQL